jgi:hypothetical protein
MAAFILWEMGDRAALASVFNFPGSNQDAIQICVCPDGEVTLLGSCDVLSP